MRRRVIVRDSQVVELCNWSFDDMNISTESQQLLLLSSHCALTDGRAFKSTPKWALKAESGRRGRGAEISNGGQVWEFSSRIFFPSERRLKGKPVQETVEARSHCQ